MKYRAVDAQGAAQIETAPMPPECFPRAMAAPSMLAHIITDKYCDGHLRPHMEAFFAWAEQQYALVREQRGLLRSALGYAVRQKDALMRVLNDGRLVLESRVGGRRGGVQERPICSVAFV